MTAVPPGAVTAAENTLRSFLEPWLTASVHGTTLESQIHTAACIAARDAAAAERQRIRQRLLGCRDCGRIHESAPGVVEVITREGEHTNVSTLDPVDGHRYRPPWQARDSGALAFLDELLGDAPLMRREMPLTGEEGGVYARGITDGAAVERERVIQLAASHAESIRASNFSTADPIIAGAIEDFAVLIAETAP